jgi:hypothetical protein
MIKLAVIIHDAGMAANVGGDVETRVKIFELPAEVSDYIYNAKQDRYKNVTLAFTDEGATK